MARTRSRGTLVDYLVVAIEPALIMIMVGSLMFFLLDTWYEGPALDRFRWILFWFVFGIVLITRVSMQIGTELAKGYGLALGGSVALVATVLGGFQPFLLMVMGIVWWATHKLTFDCTLMDEDQDTGVGLLQDSGLDPSALADDGGSAADAKGRSDDDPEAMESSLMPDRPRWKFWARDPAEKRRPHAPGVWLIYFTVASLPLFGLGQWLVPAVEEERRAWLFLYFLAYIASAMGLLLGTSFLNLRRYLRRRKLKMPAAMTATWLTTGAILIVGLTLAAAVLPLPLSAMRTARGSASKSSDLRASKYAVLKDSGVQGEGARSEGEAALKAGRKQPSSGKAEGSGKTNDPNASQQVNGRGKQGGSGKSGRSKSGQAKGQATASQNGQQGRSGSQQDRSGDQGKGRDRSGEQAKGQDQGKSQEGRSREQAEGKDEAEKGEKGSESGDEKSSQENPSQGDSSSRAPNLPSLPLLGLDWLRIPIMAAGLAIVIFGLIRYGRDFWRGLLAFIRSLLAGLGFGWERKKEEGDGGAAEEPAPPPRPFSSFVNPFDAGLDHQLTADDLVVYSFEALEAWAYEHELARSPHETPTEFVNRVARAHPGLGPDASRLVGYFVTIVYGQRGFRSEVLPPLQRFWRALEGSGAPVMAEAAMES